MTSKLMSNRSPDLSRAKKAFVNFTGHRAEKVSKAKLDDRPVAGYRLGSMLGVAYEAKRDGKTDRYFHEFGKKARPDLVVRDDGSQLYITGGKYKVTDHGIEDMPAMFVVNPSPRRRKKKAAATSSKRTAKPMARRRRKATTRRRTARRQVAVFNANPIRRRRRRRAASSSAVRRRSYRRNPTGVVRRVRRAAGRLRGGRGGLKITGLIMPAIGVGAGAVLSELAMGYLPIPANFKTGALRHVTKGMLSLALGMVVAKFANRKAGELMALGGMTIAVHDSIKEVVLKTMPSAKFGGLGYYNAGQTTGMGMYLPTPRGGFSGGMGEYINTSPGGFGDSGGEAIFSA